MLTSYPTISPNPLTLPLSFSNSVPLKHESAYKSPEDILKNWDTDTVGVEWDLKFSILGDEYTANLGLPP